MIHLIIQAQLRFAARNLEEPKNLYLGRKEWIELHTGLLGDSAYTVKATGDDDDGLRVRGLRLFLVSADSHFNVC